MHKARSPKVTATFLAVLSAVSVFGAASCNNGASVVDKPIIGTGGDYAKVLQEAERYSKDTLIKRAKGEPLNDQDREMLTLAAPQFQALVDFDPGQFAPRLALGQIYLELGDAERANDHLLYCLGNLPKEKSAEMKLVEAQCRYELANARFKVGNYEAAVTEIDQALAITNQDPNYYATRASVYLELKRTPEAEADVRKALKLNPEHRRAKSLAKLLGIPNSG